MIKNENIHYLILKNCNLQTICKNCNCKLSTGITSKFSSYFSSFTGFLWSIQDQHEDLEIQGNGTILCNTTKRQSIKTIGPILREGKFYFEVLIVKNVGTISVGICKKDHPLHRHPGWDPLSFGYHGDDGQIYCESGTATHRVGKTYKTGDLVGVLLDYKSATLTFSKGKKELKKIELKPHHLKKNLYPCVGFSKAKGAIIQLIL